MIHYCNPFRWNSAIWVTLALLSLYLVRLAGAPLFDVDEGAFAQASREMLASGDWGHTTLNGADRFDKPIFIYWCQAALMAVFGPYDWVARLPSALAVLAATFALWRFAAQQWGEPAGQRAAFMLGSSLGLLAIGRAATADGMLNALLMATGLCLWNFAASGSRSALRWAYAWCGLGLLTKGPVALLIPGITLLLWSLTTDRGRTAWRALREPTGWLLLLAIAAPWYLYALQRHEMAFIEGFFLKHNVQRFTATLEGHGGNSLYYLVVLPLLLLPWSPWCVRLFGSFLTQWANPLQRFLWIWVLFVLGFFSLSGTKLPHYMLYGLAPLVLLIVAQSVKRPASVAWQAALWGCVALSWGLAFAVPFIAAWGATTVTDTWVQPLLASAPSGLSVHLSASFVALTGLWLAFKPRGDAWARLMACVWLVSMLWVGIVIPWLGQVLQAPFQEVATWARQHHPEARIVQWRMHQPSFAFYYGAPTTQQAPTPTDWVIVRHDRMQDLPMNLYTTAHSHRGLLLLKPLP
jgi:4-amino-4-deoxy-L-arabinose transferase-like glycosyltransferase